MNKFKLTDDIICPNDFNGYARLKPLDHPSRKDDTDYITLYNEKYEIIKMAKKVNSIFEIGVRAGYSAYTFKSAFPNARYVGMDADNNSHGGQGGPWTWWAKRVMAKHFKNWLIINEDTQKLNTIPYGKYDFIHVDGDHTIAGCIHDMDICWPQVAAKGRMTIDDYTHLQDVRTGVDTWLKNNKDNYDKYEILKTVRGDVIIYKK